MSLSDAKRIELKLRAHYKCCICGSFEFLEIHHILPKKEGGTDEDDNLVPLCVCCHKNYGGNPDLRKWIKEKRDFWYDCCEKKLYNENMELLEKTYNTIEKISLQQEKKIQDLEQSLKIIQESYQQQMTQFQKQFSNLTFYPIDQISDKRLQMHSATATMVGTGIALNEVGRDLSNLGHADYLDDFIRVIPPLQPFFFTKFPEEAESAFLNKYPGELIQQNGRYTKRFLDFYEVWKKSQN